MIAIADLHTLYALRAELPTHLAAQHTKPEGVAASPNLSATGERRTDGAVRCGQP